MNCANVAFFVVPEAGDGDAGNRNDNLVYFGVSLAPYVDLFY